MSDSIKVIHIITGLEMGGAEQTLNRLLLSDLDSKKQIIVISLTGIGKIGLSLQLLGYRVYSFNFNKLLSIPLNFFFLIKLIKKYRPNIVHTWMDHANFIGGIAACFAGCSNIVWSIVRTQTKHDNKMTYVIMRFCGLLSYIIPKKIICVATAAKQAHSNFGYNEKKMVVIPCGFDLVLFDSQRINKRKIRDNLGLFPTEIVIGCVSRFHPDKGLDVFLKAVSILKKINNQNLRFMLIGRGCDKNNLELINLLSTFELSSSFILLGEREDTPECLAAMDIFCMPSRTEGFPLALVEAMSMGLACVATDVGDVNIMVGDTAVLVAPEDPEALAKALNKVINMCFEQRKILGQEASKRARSKFSMNSILNQYYSLYRKISGSNLFNS